MARMRHTGVPIEDVAYIFGITPSLACHLVWGYVWVCFGIKCLPEGGGPHDGPDAEDGRHVDGHVTGDSARTGEWDDPCVAP